MPLVRSGASSMRLSSSDCYPVFPEAPDGCLRGREIEALEPTSACGQGSGTGRAETTARPFYALPLSPEEAVTTKPQV